jgi:hypothetical protein
VTPADLQPRRHAPPAGWADDVYARVTDALAAALVAAVRRQGEDQGDGDARQEAGR